MMAGCAQHEEYLNPRQVVEQDDAEPNSTCRGFNNSSCWLRWQPLIVLLLLHFGDKFSKT